MNFLYHIHEQSIKCPYCDKDCEDDDYVVARELDNRIEFECEYCYKKFWAEACMVYNTYSDCNLNDIEHSFKPTKSHPMVFDCENCYQTEVREDA